MMAKAKRKTLPKDFEDQLAAGDLEALKRIFDLCELDARGGVFKQTALAYSACPDALARCLVEQGADLAAPDSRGDTPLHSRSGDWRAGVELLIELGADVNHDAGGRGTPLHRAAAAGHVGTVQILLAHAADPDAVDRSGKTPLLVALQNCSNATIERVAAIAELLLGATAGRAEKPRPFQGRLLGNGGKQISGVTPEMQTLVQRIGTNFEFHRANFDPDSVEAASRALDTLYALFDVAPVARRTMHDGRAPIVAGAAGWQAQHQELWKLLVPSSGAAATVQGEVIRISGRISDELERNGGVNWDADYKKMADAFLGHVGSAQALPANELARTRALVAELKARRGNAAELCKLAVAWVVLNPNPIALPAPDYRR